MLSAAVRAYYIGRRRRAAATFRRVARLVATYCFALVGVSLASREQILAARSSIVLLRAGL